MAEQARVAACSSVGEHQVGEHGIRYVVGAEQVLVALPRHQRRSRPAAARCSARSTAGRSRTATGPGRCGCRSRPGCAPPRARRCRRTTAGWRCSDARSFGVTSRSAPRPSKRDAGVGEIRLALFLVRPQRVQQAVLPGQRDAAAADQRHRLADPEARVGAGDQRVLEDGVEAGRLVVERIVVAAAVDHRSP